ncbi:hypothetical protein OIE67_53500 [Nonomuraea fuscirosea]|uniref:hypothetical protein n=1 Tax=Nonomuraea fuscirosea TaxID=1291556 RepID=UPI002DD9A71D|nr:hypothetical protein [Nonomuraea fuscirosea]WSA52731.1 hypothetical protein OIE67_53500 [Nonomuraea fuscirosea]
MSSSDGVRMAASSRLVVARAEVSGVNRQTVNDVVAGRCWPDVATIAQLEAGLAIRLWPGTPGELGGS